MTTTDLHDLFVESLRETYYAEQQLHEALGDLAAGSGDERIKDAFEQHRTETEGHVRRIEDVFDALGESPEEKEDLVVSGLIDAHSEFMEDEHGQAVIDRFNLMAGQKSEHYEIALYGNLTPLAADLGMEEVADLLEETLREEEHALQTLSDLGEEFDREHGKEGTPKRA